MRFFSTHIFLVLFVFALSQMGCNGEPTPDPEVDLCEETIEMACETASVNKYFPASPGSQWKYLDWAGDTVTLSVSTEFHEMEWKEHHPSCACPGGTMRCRSYPDITWEGMESSPFRTSSIFLYPMIEYGLRLPDGVDYCGRAGFQWAYFVSETAFVGEKYSFVSSPEENLRFWIIGKNETLVIGGVTYTDVLVVREHIRLYDEGAKIHDSWNLYYFAKDIGLIRYAEAYENGIPSYVVFNITSYSLGL